MSNSSPLTSTSRSSTPPPGAAEAAASAEPDKTTAFYKTLTENAYQYYCKAMYYYKENEIEGSLINFLLALNNLYNVKTLLSSEEYEQLFREAKEASLVKKAANNDSKKTLITSNFDSCKNELADMETNIGEAIDKVLSYVRTLQEQLKRIKNDRGTGSGPNKEDDVPCKDVKQDFISGNALTFDDVSGQDVAKDQIRSGILYPLIHPRLYPNSSKGILFYGPPGTGKTLLAKAFVNQLQKEIMNSKVDIRIIFYAPTGAELKGKYVGETEKKITNYFRCAGAAATSCTKGVMNQNREARPDKLQTKVISVLFIDEVEAIAGNRDKDESGLMTNSVNALLQMMDGVSSNENVIVMAATNYPWKLDEAILRRFDTKIYIKLPNAEDIEQVIKSEIATNYIMKALTTPENILPNLKQNSAEEKSQKLLQNKDSCTKVTEKEVKDKIPESLKLSCDDGKVCLTPYTGDADSLHPVQLFNFYRKLYFPEFTDQQIRLYSQNLEKNHYSGGDVKNICRYVYKLMGNRAKKIGRFNTETGILNPKQLKKSDQAILDKIKDKSDIASKEELRDKIIYNACDEQPFEFKTFHTGGLIDMRHYSYSQEPSFIILNLENPEVKESEIISEAEPNQPAAASGSKAAVGQPSEAEKKSEQDKIAVLMNQDTSVFFNKLKENIKIIYGNNYTNGKHSSIKNDLFIKLDVIPDNINTLVEAFLERHPLVEAVSELQSEREKLRTEEVKATDIVVKEVKTIPGAIDELNNSDSTTVSNATRALELGPLVAGAAAGVAALGVTATAGTAVLGTGLYYYLLNNENGLKMIKLKNDRSKIDSILSELVPEEKIPVPSIPSSAQTSSSEKKPTASSSISKMKPSGLVTRGEPEMNADLNRFNGPFLVPASAAVASPVAAPAQAAVEPVSALGLEKYKNYVKKYLLSMYSTLDQLFQSCKNNSQKSFYIDYYDFMLIDSKSSEIFFQKGKNEAITIMIHQQLSIHPKLSSIPFKKDIWVRIKLSNDLLDGVWSSLRRGMGNLKYFFTDYVPGKVSGKVSSVWNWFTNLVGSNEIGNINIEKTSNTDIEEIDFVKLKTLEDGSRMTNIYKMAVSIICLEKEPNQVSQLACIEINDSGLYKFLFNDTGDWTNSPAYCLSQGIIWTPEYSCGDLREAILGFKDAFLKNKLLQQKEFTLNRFLEIGSPDGSIFKNKIYFTESTDVLTENQKKMTQGLSLYKHMYMINDATSETIYKKIAEEIDKLEKVPNFVQKYKKFTKYQGDGTIIDETKTGENGTIRMINGDSYFVKNSENVCHKLWTLSYPDFNPKPAANQIVDHRTLVYETEPSSIEIVGNVSCLDELEDSRYINFSFNYADFMTAINFTNTDSIKPTVKQVRVNQLDAYSRNEYDPESDLFKEKK